MNQRRYPRFHILGFSFFDTFDASDGIPCLLLASEKSLAEICRVSQKKYDFEKKKKRSPGGRFTPYEYVPGGKTPVTGSLAAPADRSSIIYDYNNDVNDYYCDDDDK